MGIHHSPYTHPILIPMGIPMGISIPTAALQILVGVFFRLVLVVVTFVRTTTYKHARVSARQCLSQF